MNGPAKAEVRLALDKIRDYLAARSFEIVDVAGGGEGSTLFPDVAVVIAPGTPRDVCEAFGASNIGDVVRLSTECSERISASDPVFARWANRIDGTVRIFLIGAVGAMLLNLRGGPSGMDAWIEPGSAGAERRSVMS